MMVLDLLPYLIALTLPIAVIVILEIIRDSKTEAISLQGKEMVQRLEELINELPHINLDVEGSKTVHEMTHFSRDRVHLVNEDEERLSGHWQTKITNNFIRYSENQWVNAHWIEKIGPHSLELHNGVEISKQE